jgi:hypothetical protein
MRVDMSPAAVTARLQVLDELWELCVALMEAKPSKAKQGVTTMSRTIEATIDRKGRIVLHENVELDKSRRALVTILDEDPKLEVSETALMSEKALAEVWSTPEEDRAWQHLAELPSC